MKKMEVLTFLVELDWKLNTKNYKKVLDNLFNNPAFHDKFVEVLSTDDGKKWLKKDGGKKYLEWQHE